MSWVGRGSPLAPRAERQRWCSNRGLERILRWFARLLGFRDCWPIEQVEQINGLAAAMNIFESPPPGYDVLWAVGVGADIHPVTSR